MHAKRSHIVLAGSTLALLLLPTTVGAQQICPAAVDIGECPFHAEGDTTGRSNAVETYLTCPDLYTYEGPEMAYRLTLAEETHVTVVLESTFDAALVILPADGDDCNPDGCLAGSDSAWGAEFERETHQLLPAGTYYLVVDGYGADGSGSFELDVSCEHCVDADFDGGYARELVPRHGGEHHAPGCPSGDDCCDHGDEESPGCSPETAPSIYAGTEDICGDGVDQDCDGRDRDCIDSCPGATPVACGAGVAGDTRQGEDRNESYSCVPWATGGKEAYYSLTLSEPTTVKLSVTPDPAAPWDASFAVLPVWQGSCDAASCLVAADENGSGGAEAVTISLLAGTYYVAVDSTAEADAGAFTLQVGCEACTDADGDGFVGADPANCERGDDRCDTGREGGAGCDASSAAAMHPGAVDFCGDGIDHDGDGRDCSPDADHDGSPAGEQGHGDCCDLGTEASPGCTPGAANAIHPGAAEVCGNEVDEDCDGTVAAACPDCRAKTTLACPGATGLAVTTGDGGNALSDYCGLEQNAWTGPEQLYAITPEEDTTITFAIDYAPLGEPDGRALDLFLLDGFGVEGTCNPAHCLASSSTGGGGHEDVVFVARKDQTYYLAVDERQGLTGSFNYRLTCAEEHSHPEEEIAIGETKSGDTTDGSSHISAYPDVAYPLAAPEYVYEFVPETDVAATFRLTFETPLDLALVATGDGGSGSCMPSQVIAFADRDQSGGEAPEEQLSFVARAGQAYYIAVDGWRTEDRGRFVLEATSAVQCAAGETLCGGRECVDLRANPVHCGGCGEPCAAGEECSGGTCRGESEPDAGVEPGTDGGVEPVVDGGGDPDAGGDPEVDAGQPQGPDSGGPPVNPASETGSDEGGCACASAGDGARQGGAMGLLLLLGIVGLRRRGARRG